MAISGLEKRNPATRNVAQWLNPNPNLTGLALHIAVVIEGAADEMIDQLDDGPELTTGLRKLLEAKDCFVRAALDVPQ